MKRVLVIQDDALWLALSGHLAGRADIQLSETPSLTLGLGLAQVQSPDLIVCRSGTDGQSPEDFARLFEDRNIDISRVVCVQEDVNRETAANLANTGMSLCSPARFLDVVDRILRDTAQSAGPPRLHLLAHYQLISSEPSETQRGFVNLLEISHTELLIESRDPLNEGDSIKLNFLLPRTSSTEDGSERAAVALTCKIGRREDRSKLHYWATSPKVEPESQAPLDQFIRSQCGRKGSL